MAGIPEVFTVAAVAVMGKSGFAWVKGKAFGFLKRHGPPEVVSLTRYRIGLVFVTQGRPTWEAFDVPDFLFSELWEGGTVGFFGSVPIFFDQMMEALRRFAADGLVDATAAEGWLAVMSDARKDFIECYDEETSERSAAKISRRWQRAS
ncbi:MAG: hypothetical protein JRH11_12605 [Deltaproteobacteria bacterium]|nr:hypothetical protein [Deltaproteobacteria bacterium]